MSADGVVRALGDRLPDVDATAWVASTSVVIGAVTLAARASVFYGAVVRADLAEIHIGERSNIQDNVSLHGDPGHDVRIGTGVSIGHNAVLHGCIVEDDCLIGMGAIVMNGAVVGRGSLIAAGALVPEGMVIPPGSLVAGVPGKVRRSLTAAEVDGIALNATVYLDLAARHAEAESVL